MFAYRVSALFFVSEDSDYVCKCPNCCAQLNNTRLNDESEEKLFQTLPPTDADAFPIKPEAVYHFIAFICGGLFIL